MSAPMQARGQAPVLPTDCDCGRKAVCLAVTYPDIRRAEEQRDEINDRMDRDYPRGDSGLRAVPMTAYLTPGGKVPFIASWQPKCGACADAVMSYCVDYDRLRSPLDALGWTLHLLTKNWYSVTDWGKVMYRTFPGTGVPA